MKLDPTATDEMGDFPVLEEGDYEFEVVNTVYQQNAAKTGYQWKVQFRIDPPTGQSVNVWEYFPEKESLQWKFNQFFKAIGKNNVTDTAEMKNVIREIGMCHLVIDPANNGYAAKNKVKYFIVQKAEQDPKGININSDDLPF